MSTPLPAPRHAAPTDAALVVAARAGESWGCEALYRRHAPGMHGLAYRLIGRDTDVDDIVQDSFIDAFSSLEGLKSPALFRSWLGGIVVRKTCKLLRRRRLLSRLGLAGRGEPVELDSVLSPTAPPDAVAELRAVYAVLASLPTDARIVLVLRRVEGASLDEIATLTGASLATVKRRVVKGEQLLNEAMADRVVERGGSDAAQ